MKINLVDIIPQKRSNEINFDSEPSITVDPRAPNRIVITAFTPVEGDEDAKPGGSRSPIFYSIDSGLTWNLCPLIPGIPDDISVRFGHTSGVLYLAVLNESSFDAS